MLRNWSSGKKMVFLSKKMCILRISKSQKLKPQTNLTSSPRANFRLDIFQCKTFLYSSWGRKNDLKGDRINNIFSHLNFWLHSHILYVYALRMNTFILHQSHHSHACQGSCTSVKYTQLLAKFCLIVWFTSKLSSNMYILSDFGAEQNSSSCCVSSRTAFTRKLRPFEVTIFVNWWSSVFVAKKIIF